MKCGNDQEVPLTPTINLEPEAEAGLLAQAQAQGLDVSDYVGNLVRGWTLRHASDNLPILPDEAISRDFIYGERGL